MQLIIFGFAINLDVNSVPMIVCDQDHSLQSHDFIARFETRAIFQLLLVSIGFQDIDKYLVRGDASLALTIPVDFGKKILKGGTGSSRGKSSMVRKAERRLVGLNYAAAIVAGYSQEILPRKLFAAWFWRAETDHGYPGNSRVV